MKKLHSKQKLHLARHAKRIARRKKIWKSWRKQQGKNVLLDAIHAKYGDRPRYLRSVRSTIVLELPSDLSLERNYDEVMNFFADFRSYTIDKKQLVYVDFRPVRRVSAAASLILAAELDRWHKTSRRTLQIRDAAEWDPDVFRLLNEMGLYDLLSVINKPPPQQSGNQKFIKFRSSNLVLGELAVSLREDLVQIFGDDSFARRRLLYEALVEAMSNSRRHAYPEDFPKSLSTPIGLWWMSGAYNPNNKTLTVMFYDQGVGIPATIPRKGRWEHLRGWLAEKGLSDDDASRIKASIELGATQTKEPHRGLGMQRNILRYVEGHPNDRLRILSAKGEYIYHGDGTDEFKNHTRSLGGTLIQWELGADDSDKVQ